MKILKDEQEVKAFETSISQARFARYLAAGDGDHMAAMALYHWNSLLSQSLYLPLQIWEISLRNKLNAFLCWKYGGAWPHDHVRALRQMTRNDMRRIGEAVDRIAQDQRISHTSVPTDAVVAELSAGFWVSLLSNSYTHPFTWQHNLSRVMPNRGALDRAAASEKCGKILTLRNRVAHHEPIFQMPLSDLRADLTTVIGALCPTALVYASSTCTFAAVHAVDPRVAKPLAAQ